MAVYGCRQWQPAGLEREGPRLHACCLGVLARPSTCFMQRPPGHINMTVSEVRHTQLLARTPSCSLRHPVYGWQEEGGCASERARARVRAARSASERGWTASISVRPAMRRPRTMRQRAGWERVQLCSASMWGHARLPGGQQPAHANVGGGGGRGHIAIVRAAVPPPTRARLACIAARGWLMRSHGAQLAAPGQAGAAREASRLRSCGHASTLTGSPLTLCALAAWRAAGAAPEPGRHGLLLRQEAQPEEEPRQAGDDEVRAPEQRRCRAPTRSPLTCSLALLSCPALKLEALWS